MARAQLELRRRIDQPFDLAKRALSTPAMLRTGMTMGFGHDGLLVLQAPFRPAPSPHDEALHAPAALTSSRGRSLGLVRFELSAWPRNSTSLLLLPLTSRTDRWSPRRVNQYLELARLCADAVARIVGEEVAPHFGAAASGPQRPARADPAGSEGA